MGEPVLRTVSGKLGIAGGVAAVVAAASSGSGSGCGSNSARTCWRVQDWIARAHRRCIAFAASFAACGFSSTPRAGGPVFGGPLVDVALTVASISLGAGSIYGVQNLADMGWISGKAMTKALSVASPLITMVQYVSPAPVVADGIRRMNAQNLPTQVFQSQAACNILGIAYAIQIANAAVLVTNMFGLACQVLFLTGDHYVRSSQARWVSFSLQLIAILNSNLYFWATVAPITALGNAITIFNVVLFASPLAKLGTILRTRNASSLPTAMIFISVANNAVWTLYALMIQDIVLLLPSILGYFLSSFQVLVILWCRGVLPWDLGFLLLPCGHAGGELGKTGPDQAEEIAAILPMKPTVEKQKDSPLTPMRTPGAGTIGAGDTAAGGTAGWSLSPLNARGAGIPPKVLGCTSIDTAI